MSLILGCPFTKVELLIKSKRIKFETLSLVSMILLADCSSILISNVFAIHKAQLISKLCLTGQ